MKKMGHNQKHLLKLAVSAAAADKKTLLVSSFIFLTGISTGVFLELTMSPEEKSGLAIYLQQYLAMDSGTFQYPNPFFSSLAGNLLLLLIIFLAGLSVLGFPAAPVVLGYKGMALGFCTGLIAETLKSRGILVVLTSLLPQNLILIPAFILASSSALNYGILSLRSRKKSGIKKNLNEISGSYICLMIALAIAVIAACGIEAILYPVVL